MFDVIAGWFAVGLFVAGCWIVVGSFLPVSHGPSRTAAGRPSRPARSAVP